MSKVSGGEYQVLVNKNRKRKKVGDWHHRVPDFQLVYCGPKKKIIIKEGKIKEQIINAPKKELSFQ